MLLALTVRKRMSSTTVNTGRRHSGSVFGKANFVKTTSSPSKFFHEERLIEETGEYKRNMTNQGKVNAL